MNIVNRIRWINPIQEDVLKCRVILNEVKTSC